MASVAELLEMDEQELLDNLASAQQELFNLRFQHVTGQLDNYSRLRDLRKDIARLHTVLRAREIAEAEQQELERRGGDRASAAGSGDGANG